MLAQGFLPVHRPASCVGPYRLGAVHEVTLRDGTLQRLIQLHDNGAPSAHLRALQISGSKRMRVFDVRRVAYSLAADLPSAPARDVPGLVAYSLRGLYPTSHALERAIDEACVFAAEPVVLQQQEGEQC